MWRTARTPGCERRCRTRSTDWESQPSLGQLDRAKGGFRLVPALLVLLCRVGIEDDAGAGLDVGGSVLDQNRADRDAHVKVAGVAEEADGAGVTASPGWLEFVDDLHGPHLRRAGHGAGGEGGAD